MDANGFWSGLTSNNKAVVPRFLVIGAGSRGNAYARAIDQSTDGHVVAIAEPIKFKRKEFGKRYIWKNLAPRPEHEFSDWRDFITYEEDRRKRASAGESVEDGVDGVFVCTLDTQHAEIITALGPLKLNIMSEKPLATILDDCLNIYASLLPDGPESTPQNIFSIGHVLRYSPHNMLLRSLILHQRVIGDVLSMEHTEPVGWWHFSHSYVRGNWRKESTTAPSLLTKSCHDIDLILWLLASPASPESGEPPHLPTSISSAGHLSQFRKVRKPKAAGHATNCLSCPIETSCIYSAKKIYLDKHLKQGLTDWPVKIVDPEIEDCYNTQGAQAAEKRLLQALEEDYDQSTMSQADVDKRPWFGRCVWECANDVCDDQTVTITWDDDVAAAGVAPPGNRMAKTATFHQIAHTEAQCARRGRIYGTTGEITYDSKTIRVYDFGTGSARVHYPAQPGGGHGGGDDGLVRQFVGAVQAVKGGEMQVSDAQKKFVGCTVEDVVRSHALVFAAEEARRSKKVVDWQAWWSAEVEKRLMEKKGWHVVN